MDNWAGTSGFKEADRFKKKIKILDAACALKFDHEVREGSCQHQLNQ